MKFLTDLFPVILFFLAYHFADIYTATAVAIAAAFIQVGYGWLRYRKVEKMQLVTLALLAFFGGLTLILRDPLFIMWKPTVINWLFGVAFIGSQFIGQRTLVQRMMGHAVTLPSAIWIQLNLAWAIFFLAMGGLNLYVAFNYAEETWVNFKLFGMMGLTFLFVILQTLYMTRFITEQETTQEES
ncbi:MAG: septation protein A [Sedimenticola sp.]